MFNGEIAIGKVYGFHTLTTRGQAEKSLLGDPESALSGKWLKALHSGDEYADIIPWNVRNLPGPTNRQILLRVSTSHKIVNGKPNAQS